MELTWCGLRGNGWRGRYKSCPYISRTSFGFSRCLVVRDGRRLAPRPWLPGSPAAGRRRRRPSLRRSATFACTSCSPPTSARSRWHVGLEWGREFLVITNRIVVELPPRRRKAAHRSSRAAPLRHAHPTTSSGTAPPVLLRIVQHWRPLRLPRLLRPRRQRCLRPWVLHPRHLLSRRPRTRPTRTWTWATTALRRPLVLHERSTRFCRPRAMRSRAVSSRGAASSKAATGRTSTGAPTPTTSPAPLPRAPRAWLPGRVRLARGRPSFPSRFARDAACAKTAACVL